MCALAFLLNLSCLVSKLPSQNKVASLLEMQETNPHLWTIVAQGLIDGQETVSVMKCLLNLKPGERICFNGATLCRLLFIVDNLDCRP